MSDVGPSDADDGAADAAAVDAPPSGPSKMRAVLAAVDQGISGLGSFALTAAVARVAGVETVGQFALAYLTFQIALSMTRQGMTQAYMVRRSTTGIDTLAADRDLIRATSWVSLLAGAIALASAMVFVSGTARTISALLAIAFPIVAVCDCMRFIAIGRHRPGLAILFDSVQTFGFIAGVAIWTVTGTPTALGVVILWGVMSVIGLAISFVVLRLRPYRPRIRAWWSDHGTMSLAFGGENIMTRIAAYSVTYGLVWFASIPALAGFRAGSSLTNLVTLFFAAIPMVVMPHYRTQLTAATSVVQRGQLMRIAGVISFFVAAITAAGSVVLLSLPASIGHDLFGDTWPEARVSLPGLLFWTAGAGAINGPLTVLRATARIRQGLTARALNSIAVMVCGFVGAALGGAPGAAWGLGLGAWLGVAAWFRVVWVDGDWDPASDRVAQRLEGDVAPARA